MPNYDKKYVHYMDDIYEYSEFIDLLQEYTDPSDRYLIEEECSYVYKNKLGEYCDHIGNLIFD